jgi:hypothetical protein
VTIQLVANLVTVVVAGVFIGIALRAIPPLFEAQEEQLEAFVDAVATSDPSAVRRWDRITRFYRRIAPVSMLIERLEGGGSSLRVERSEGGFKSFVMAVLMMAHLILGLRATLVLVVMIGLVVVLIGSLLFSPLGFNLLDLPLLILTVFVTYRIVFRLQERAELRAS